MLSSLSCVFLLSFNDDVFVFVLFFTYPEPLECDSCKCRYQVESGFAKRKQFFYLYNIKAYLTWLTGCGNVLLFEEVLDLIDYCYV